MENKIFIINKNLYNDMNENLIGKYAIYVDGAGMFPKCDGYMVMNIYSKTPLEFEEIIVLNKTKEKQICNKLDLSYSLRTRKKLNAINELKRFYYYIMKTELWKYFHNMKENFYYTKKIKLYNKLNIDNK